MMTTAGLAGCYSSSPAQTAAPEAAFEDSLGVASPDSIEIELGSSFVPIPVLFYAPETGLGFGASAAYVYRHRGSTVRDRPSVFAAVFILTTRAQLMASLGGNHYWSRERNLLQGGVLYRKFPNLFFGIGNDNPVDGGEDYTDEGPALNLEYLRLIAPSLRAGLTLDAGSSSITETEAGRLSSGLVPGSSGGNVVGLGASANLDNRDNINYTRSGGLYAVRWRGYDQAIGSDYDFTSTTIDFRAFTHLRGLVLGAHAVGMHSTGVVPFQLMPALGGDNLLRGYFAGRFRDNDLLAFQLEARFRVWWRFGMVVFGSAGQVAHQPSEIAMSRFHPSYGFGIRFLIISQESLHLRMDFGFGEDESGFYLGFGEVF